MTTPPEVEVTLEEETATPPTRREEDKKTRNQAEDKLRLKHIKKFLMKFAYNGDDDNWIQETRGALLVVATVILAMSYQPVLSPPGGLCQETVAEGSVCGAGKSILAHTNRSSFNTYMSLNTVTFSASLATIFILISGIPLNHKLAMSVLGISICTALVTLALSYIAALFEISPLHIFMGGYVKIITPLYGLIGIFCSVILFHFLRSCIWIFSSR